ncbi:fumarate hydratase [Desulfovibrio litoralis]|uniref:Fumarase, class I alpha subunit n=1 Tax=Desulfovibrio litoralis DSM 11393 TaxID=1121455 RepID=A0A1M7RQY2_9BACT|nr:fumarate hydratase [Desulfovibrio litoralis]SHN48590.1 fumarase, class I alpha subunit [Desulfovibrio litoralis DSM 11393]
MKNIKAKEIHKAVVDMILDCNRILRDDIRRAFVKAQKDETTPVAQEIFRQLLENADYAKESGLALCQDCGVSVFFVEYGEDIHIEGGSLKEVLNQATIEAYDKGCLRKSVCDPFTRKNTGNNTPAMIHTEIVPGNKLSIRYMAKGGGSENMSRTTMLTPSQGWAGIKDFVVRRMAEAGPNPCPPTIVGVGIGGTFDIVSGLAKKALFRSLDTPHPDPAVAALEQELFEAINALGTGPMGLGGKTTCLGVKIEVMPCHIASLPVAINVQCHSSRHGEVTF